jgi:outer membrane receptor protein involved in Fe transport
MKTIIYMLFLLIPFQLLAQKNVKGLVTDQLGNSLDGATITVSQDGKIVGQTLADRGNFLLNNLDKGSYQVSVSLIGYLSVERNFVLPTDTITIILKQNATSLKDVVISARTAQVVHQADKTTFNVQNSILASGGNVWDALGKAPGVQTTTDGQVTANNKGVTVYINDKPVQLTGENLAAYLSSLPSDNVAKIEVITNPSAKYDAQGGSILNIITKKSKMDGFNGTLGAGYTQATFGSYNANSTFNYRKDKLNIYGNFGYSEKKLDRHVDSYTIYQTPDSYSDWQSIRESTPRNNAASYQAGADYNLTDNQVIGILINGFNGRRSNFSANNTSIFNDRRQIADSLLNTVNHLNGRTNQYSFNANYKVKLDSTGRSLNIDIDYLPYRNNAGQYVNAISKDKSGSIGNSFNIYTPSLQNIDIWSGKLDYSYHAGKTWHLESGVKYTSIRSVNMFNYFDMDSGSPIFDSGRSSNFRYIENTSAGYTSISGKLKQWSLEGGIRAEYTNTEGHSFAPDSVNKRNYLKLFPTLSVSYTPSEDHVFSFTYDIRIDRPGYFQLNPARAYSTPYSFQQGNPSLQPYLTTNLGLSYTFKQNYSITASYSKVDGQISNVTVQDNISKTIYDTQQNLDHITDFGIQFQANINPASWWEMNLNAEGDFRKQNSRYLDGNFGSHNVVADLSTTQSFLLSQSDGLKAELRAAFRTPINQGLLYIDKTNDVSAGISKSVFGKQATIKLAFADILYGNPYRISTNYLNQNNGSFQKNDTRNVTLSFTYRFGKNIASSRKRKTATDEESKRTN